MPSLSGNYIDPHEFTVLFRRHKKNREAIAAGLLLLAQNAVRRYHVAIPQDLEDAASAATLTALRKIHRFDCRRRGANAFSYFSTVMFRAIGRELAQQHQARQRDREISAANQPPAPAGKGTRIHCQRLARAMRN